MTEVFRVFLNENHLDNLRAVHSKQLVKVKKRFIDFLNKILLNKNLNFPI